MIIRTKGKNERRGKGPKISKTHVAVSLEKVFLLSKLGLFQPL